MSALRIHLQMDPLFIWMGEATASGRPGDETVRVWLVSAPLTTTVVEVEGW